MLTYTWAGVPVRFLLALVRFMLMRGLRKGFKRSLSVADLISNFCDPQIFSRTFLKFPATKDKLLVYELL